MLKNLLKHKWDITLKTPLAIVDSKELKSLPPVLYWGTERGSKFNKTIYKKHV